jgi:glycerol-3-phosphate dehydrogenase
VSAYDLLIIGGGINGLGIAADASARGLRVLLVEKGDFGSGTTSTSSRLIHGGLRYLQYGEFGLVRESLRERGILARQRPHLVRPIDLLIPSYRGRPPRGCQVAVGLRLYNFLARDPLFPAPRSLSREEALRREPGLQPERLIGGHLYPDAQIPFPERLCVELMRDTRASGGEALNYTRVTSLREAGGRITGAELADERTGATRTVEAALTINAAGPWVDVVNDLLPHPPSPQIGGTWGTHLVLPVRPGGPSGHLYAAARQDGRPFFLLPWDGRLLVGTTDVPFHGDPDSIRPRDWEIPYLLRETNTLFPSCDYREEDVQFTTIGVRPLPRSHRRAGSITRRHFLVDHRKHGLAGLASIVGGKLTTYRSLAEETVDWALRTLGKAPVPCCTGRVPDALPAGSADDRLDRLYGPRADEVRALERSAELAEPLLPGCPASRAEVVYAVREEAARTPDDVLRRRLMLLPPTDELLEAVRAVWSSLGLPGGDPPAPSGRFATSG